MAPQADYQPLSILFAQCGFNALESKGGSVRLDTALRNLKEALDAESPDAIRRKVVIGEAIKRLRKADVEDAPALVKAAVGSSAARIRFPTITPSGDPVDGAGVLDLLSDLLSRHLILPPGAADGIALWIVHTYCLDAAQISPMLHIFSPVMRCGKTELVKLLKALVCRALSVSNISSAALFRTMDKRQPCLLIDEADTHGKELSQILNTGHSRATAFVIRTGATPDGDDGDFDTREFSTWGAKVVAGIGKLLETTMDRSIRIPMRRMKRTERIEPFRDDRIVDDCEPIRGWIAQWAIDHMDALKAAEPQIPSELHSRAKDNWRILLAIADRAGGAWAERGRAAARLLTGKHDKEDDGPAVLLLGDIRQVFEHESNTGRVGLRTDELLEQLKKREDRPWHEWKDGAPLTAGQLAKLLRQFEITPGQFREGAKGGLRGYKRTDFEDAWSRYLPDDQPAAA